MQNRILIQQISETRLKEARLLFENSCYDGACYLAGYCIELALKSTICKILEIDDLFTRKAELIKPFKTHDLDMLLIYAGLQNKFEVDKMVNPSIISSWSYIKETLRWSEELRYQEIGTRTQAETQQLLNAVNTILLWIKNYW
jgi:HEPN domain-containing protein